MVATLVTTELEWKWCWGISLAGSVTKVLTIAECHHWCAHPPLCALSRPCPPDWM